MTPRVQGWARKAPGLGGLLGCREQNRNKFRPKAEMENRELDVGEVKI